MAVLLPEEALGQYCGIQRADGLSVVAEAPHWRHVTEMSLAEEVLGLMNSVFLFRQQELLPHVVLKFVLRRLLCHFRLGWTIKECFSAI